MMVVGLAGGYGDELGVTMFYNFSQHQKTFLKITDIQ